MTTEVLPSSMNRVQAWILATRPKTLTAALAPILVATAYAVHVGYPVRWWISICALLAAMGIQIATNLFNDALDYMKGTDTAERLGPTRVTQSGMISARSVISAAFFCYLLAASFGLPLIFEGGVPILIAGLLSFLFGYAYTGGPYPISYLGVGEIFVILFFGIVAVGGVVYLQIGAVSSGALLAGLQIGILSTVMLAINNLRDIEGDAKNNKRSFAVRFGVDAAKMEIAFLCFVPFLLNVMWLLRGSFVAALLPLLSLPLAFKVVRSIYHTPPSRAYNAFLGKAAGLHLLFGILLSLGLVFG